MRVVLQRVSRATVSVAGNPVGQIEAGWLALVGIAPGDGTKQFAWMADKIANLRCFADGDGKMNRSVQDIRGAVLAVSNFTLYADCQKGRRPSFLGAAKPEEAVPKYREFLDELLSLGIPVQSGVFGADMQIELVNDGPVTLILDTPGQGIVDAPAPLA